MAYPRKINVKPIGGKIKNSAGIKNAPDLTGVVRFNQIFETNIDSNKLIEKRLIEFNLKRKIPEEFQGLNK